MLATRLVLTVEENGTQTVKGADGNEIWIIQIL